MKKYKSVYKEEDKNLLGEETHRAWTILMRSQLQAFELYEFLIEAGCHPLPNWKNDKRSLVTYLITTLEGK